ncbi:molybdenum cofactor guanylyltransferase [Planctomycetota bacterium]|nr:molybdenum cofactor guanylyltransferase [Planctomycetota bacterium]
MNNKDKLPLFILAGGLSSRFGSDKARIQIQDKNILQIITSTFSPYISSTTVIADKPDKYSDLKLQTIIDSKPGYRGPLAGLLTAAEHTSKKNDHCWFMLTSCDTINISPKWIKQLLAMRSSTYQAIVFRDDRYQPFPGIYHSNIAKPASETLNTKQASMQNFLANINIKTLPVPKNWKQMIQINTQNDLDQAKIF